MKGTIVTRETKAGAKRYHVVFREPGGKQVWKTFTKLRAAEKYLSSKVNTVQDGTYVAVQPVSMDELFDAWLDKSLDIRQKLGKVKPSTAKAYRSMVRTHLRPALKDYRSDGLTGKAMSDWVAARADEIASGTMSPKFFNNLVNLLSSILKWARGSSQRFLAHDPLVEVERLPRAKVERDFLEPPELEKLLEAAKAPDDTILYVAAYSGVRRGELFGLKWSDVDWERSQIHVQRSLFQGAITTPKTERSERVVDVPARLVGLLRAYRECNPPLEGNFIFRTEVGSPLDPDNWFKRSFTPTVKRAGLRAIGLHTLRHTYASLLINQGENPKYVSKQLGHASVSITVDLYGHLFRETSVSAMNRLSMRMPGAASENVVPFATGTDGD